MKRAVKTWSFILAGGLIVAGPTVPVRGQPGGETSVPEPTRLHSAALADGSKRVWSELIGGIESDDAHAAVSIIVIESRQRERVRGIEITLESSTATDRIYVPEGLLTNFRDELEHLEFSRQFANKCEAQRLCLYGIARCRPSQPIRQAYCPGRYSTPGSEEGLNLSTPRHSFTFPSVGTEQLISLISKAIDAMQEESCCSRRGQD